MPLTTGSADHRRILIAAADWRGAPMALATVVETWRSAPCPVGTHMLIHADGRFVGSVSGGCVEGDVLHHAEAIIAGAPAEVRRYGVANDAAWEVGLPCGGDIAVLIQPVSNGGFAPALFDAIAAAGRTGKTLMIATDIAKGISHIVEARTDDAFLNVYAPPRRILIVGAVEVAVALATITGSMGFDVTIVDPRARFLTSERFPGLTLDDRWPDEAIAAHAPDSRTAVVTLSHDIKIDDPALIAALATPAAYVGALGSKASHRARRDRLRATGLSNAQLDRIEGPAGLEINSITAPEIALSIAAGIIRTFNHGLR